MFYTKAILKSFTKFTGKTLLRSLSFNLQLQACKCTRKVHHYMCFPQILLNFVKEHHQATVCLQVHFLELGLGVNQKILSKLVS